jgi:outer membrane receptor protein involved in Fe transport
MKLKIAALIATWITIASTFAFAQSGFKISGKINGSDGKSTDGATVYLRRSADSVLVKTALADASGTYLFESVKKGDYKILVTMMGYQQYKGEVIKLDQQDIGMPIIILQQSGTTLKEVTVSSQKPLVEHLIDRTVVNPDALISNAGSTALDVLDKSPGVIVDENGGISLQGKNNVKIFIDGKPTYLSGADLENYLRSLPSSSIDQIELMTNPPAKYDAAGNGGVINIRTKRGKARGFNGGVNLSYSQGHYAKTNDSFNFNYRDNKINMFGNLGFSTSNNYNDLDINRHFVDDNNQPISNFLQNSFIRRKSQSYNTKIGLDYYASDKTTWGIVLTGLINPSTEQTLNKSNFMDAQNVLDSTIIAHNAQDRKFKNGGINLNYRHEYDKKGRELTADVDYLNYSSNNAQTFNNFSYLPDGTLANNDMLTGSLPANIHIYSAKADYTQPLTSGIKLSVGGKTSYTKTDNVADYFYTVNDVTTPDYGKTNHFIYKETINAGYINATKDFKRISLQAGLRFENTISDGNQLGNIQKPDSTFKRNYNGLFPTFYIQYKLDSAGKQTLGLNYGRRIDRPYYQDLNPFISPLDKFTYYTGNPFLKPSYTNELELSHNYKNIITTTLEYSKTHDDVNETIEIIDGIYYSRPGNLGTTTVKAASVNATFDFYKWLNFNLFTNVVNIHTVSDFYTGTLDTKGTYFSFRPIFQFKFTHGWNWQLDGQYQSKVTSAQFIVGQRGKVNTGLSKKLSSSTTLKLVVNDIFHSMLNSGIINNLANTHADYHNVSDTRTGVLSLSYRFGKALSDQRKHNANGAEDEQSRVKN